MCTAILHYQGISVHGRFFRFPMPSIKVPGKLMPVSQHLRSPFSPVSTSQLRGGRPWKYTALFMVTVGIIVDPCMSYIGNLLRILNRYMISNMRIVYQMRYRWVVRPSNIIGVLLSFSCYVSSFLEIIIMVTKHLYQYQHGYAENLDRLLYFLLFFIRQWWWLHFVAIRLFYISFWMLERSFPQYRDCLLCLRKSNSSAS